MTLLLRKRRILVPSPLCCICLYQETLHKSTDFGVRICSSWASKELCSWIQMIHSLWMEPSALEATLATGPALRALQTSHNEAVSNHWCTWKQLAARQTAESGEEGERDQTESMWELLEPRQGVKKKGVWHDDLGSQQCENQTEIDRIH